MSRDELVTYERKETLNRVCAELARAIDAKRGDRYYTKPIEKKGATLYRIRREGK